MQGSYWDVRNSISTTKILLILLSRLVLFWSLAHLKTDCLAGHYLIPGAHKVADTMQRFAIKLKMRNPSCLRQSAFGTMALAIDMGSRTDYVHSCHLCKDRRSQEGCAHLLSLLVHLSCWLCGAWLCFLVFIRVCQGFLFKQPDEGEKMVGFGLN